MVRIAPGGYGLAVPAAVAAAVTGVLAAVKRRGALAAASLAFGTIAAAILAFHRDPERTPPPEGVVSPADGTVNVVDEEDGRTRVAVYMHPTSVHVNRAPLDGVVTDVEHVPGGHVPAFDKESDRNEHVHVDFEEYRVTLIAGVMARRIHPYVDAGDDIGRGDRIGHISFGSRVDTLLPESYDPADVSVGEGDAVRAGETVIARDPDA